MITAVWGARHGQGVTSIVAQSEGVLDSLGRATRVVDCNPEFADLGLWAPQKARDESTTVDQLLEEAEIAEVLRWPDWTQWQGRVLAQLGSVNRPYPTTPSREAATRFWNALREQDNDDVDILVDAGSGMRDYLTVRILAEAPRLVVVTRVDVPDLLATQNTLRFLGDRIVAQDKVLAFVGTGGATQEVLEAASGFRAVPVPENNAVREMRNAGKVLAGGVRNVAFQQFQHAAAAIVQVATETQAGPARKRRGLWRH